jgi:hypothetical protein
MNPSWTGTCSSRHRSTIRRVSAISWAMGFSLHTALPALMASSIRGAWVLVGVTITTASTSGSWMASTVSVEARLARASSRPRSAASAMGSATTTTWAFGIAARLRTWVWPMRPAPRTATPMSLGSLSEKLPINTPWSGRHGP